ncbi:putative Proprionate catabolism activator, Fis family [uncultured delta proteobacterium]|uniref:Putative Proprionate catabolism activator, Fis family n=1 Tax=uncultured delta proteobacterium TaxID=34034 RepID=A0A212JBZ5_9DELT|nr:putative Proprionate catabolism activator, Fis family [uncultured delta proteobacterium]
MPPRIVLVSPSQKISERARRVAADLALDIDLVIHEAVGEAAVSLAKEVERQGADVIVSRGINCPIIQNAVQTPVVEMPVTGQDLATALHGAKKYTKLDRPRIALLAFTSVQHHVEVLAELLDIDLRIYPVINDQNFNREQVLRAKEDGAHIVVAGNLTGNLAREYGVPALLLDSGEVALSGALLEAQKLAYARRLEKVRSKRLQAAVDISQNGVLVLDAQGIIQAVNTEARRILHLEAGLEGRKASDVLPEELLAWCNRNEAVSDELLEINGTPLLLNANTVSEGTAVTDVIFTLQPVAAISELESKLRKSLHARGLACQYSFRDILGVSAAIQSTVATARSFAATDSPILLAGETGTGKELFAQAIHQVSPFASGPFVAINCAALPASLLESELFGHEEGAFTGARRNGKPGLFELAHNGTIFLDEISEMNQYGQTRLLRVLQERSTMRIGGDKYIPVTARVIAASNRDLPDLVERKRFRQDLYYRLNVLPLHIPPLRERRGDIAFLAGKFVEQFRMKYGAAIQLTPGMTALLEAHPWPGNVRELSGIIERLALLARTGPIREAHLESALRPERRRLVAASPVPSPAEPERQRILDSLDKNNGHIGRAAASLGMHRTTLQRKIRALGINLHRTAV